MSPFSRSTLASTTGAQLALFEARAEGNARGVVQVHHGLAEHAQRYGELARFLGARGWHVTAHDHRGHGASWAADAPRGVFAAKDGWAAVVADALAVNAHIRARDPGLPVVVFGHSMGGSVAWAQVLASPKSADAAAIWNANISFGGMASAVDALLRLERLLVGPQAPSRLLDSLTFKAWSKRFTPARTGFDWLSRDEAEVDAYIADPNCGWPASVGLWRDLAAGARLAMDEAKLAGVPRTLPLHLLAGGQDPVTEKGRLTRRFAAALAKAGFTNVALVVNAEARHEALHETDRAEAMEGLAEWLDTVLGRPR